MKPFILRLLIFSMAASVVIVTPIIYKRCFEPPVDFAIEKSKSTLILGDSHTECAINDSIFADAANYSMSAEAYLYSYIKLRHFISANSHIKTVILGFSFYSLSDLYDYWYYRDDVVEKRIPSFMYFMNFRELAEIARLNPGAFYRATFSETTRESLRADRLDDLQMGGYLRLNRYALDEDLKIIRNTPKSEFKLSNLQVKYLEKIIDFCRQNSIRLIFLNTPMYEGGGTYYMRNEFNKLYQSNYKSIPLLDYVDYKMPDSCYGDASHLNYIGAIKFSSVLNEQLNQLNR